MSEIYISSDLHLGHANILTFRGLDGNLIRGDRFSSVEEMNETIIANHNAVVKPTDKWYNLGDVYMSIAHQALSRMNGKKRLILGNHDNAKDQHLTKHFEKITLWRFFSEFGTVLTHVPIHDSSLVFKMKYNIHGHIHEKRVNDPRYFNASVEAINYTPLHIEEIVKILEDRNA